MAYTCIRPSKIVRAPTSGLAREVRRSRPRLQGAGTRAFHVPMASLVVDFPRIASPAKEWLTSKVPVWSGFDGNAINRIFIHDIVHSDPIKTAALMATAATLIGLGGGHVLAWFRGSQHEEDSLQTLKEDRRTGLAWLAVITAIALWCSAGDVSFK